MVDTGVALPPSRYETDGPAMVVEITRPIAAADLGAVARRVADELSLPEPRMRELIAARVGPITQPMRPTKARLVVRIFEKAGVAVAARPVHRASGTSLAPAVAPEALRSEEAVVPAALRSEEAVVPAAPRAEEAVVPAAPRRAPADRRSEASDAYVAAVLAGMIAIALVDGPATDAELRAVQRALEAMTGADVGRERIERLARARGADDLAQAATLLAEHEPSLSDDAKAAALSWLLLAAAASDWSLETVRGVESLGDALHVPGEVVRARMANARPFGV